MVSRSAVVKTVVTAETSGRRRIVPCPDANDPNLIGDDVEDATNSKAETRLYYKCWC